MDLTGEKIKVACPECSHEQKILLSQAERQEKIKCPGCGKTIALVDKGGSVKRGLRNTKRAIGELEKTIRNTEIRIG